MSELFEKIPNNVNLSSDKKLQKALEAWQPDFLSWWKDMGPTDFEADWIYLRTAVSVDANGWANFDYVRMADYRWGIFLTPPTERTIHFGDHVGAPIWNEVPGEFRKELRRIIVTQADTEPASVEQQRLLGLCAPSLYDLRNLFQVNVEEGRHLWAMVYLLHSHFGRDGREEADDLLARRSGNADSPRILQAFNEPIRTWMDFFCFTMFTDRDGKYQLAALAESSFDPLARSTQFMLTEEAHHLFVGETGINRIIQRTVELMKQTDDVTKAGGIPLDVIQKYVNKWFTLSLDLFGGEDSSNAATYFAQGLKGRYKESTGRYGDPVALEGEYDLEELDANGKLTQRKVPLRRAMNLVLRDAYAEDCERAVRKWNKTIEAAGIPFRIALPSQRFHRHQGIYAGHTFSPTGERLTAGQWIEKQDQWLPSAQDQAYVESLMQPCYEPGKFAGWIAPPHAGIDAKPQDFRYVQFAKDLAHPAVKP